MRKYIIERKDGVVEYYAGMQYAISRRFTSNRHLATRYADEMSAERIARLLEYTFKDAQYNVIAVMIVSLN